MAVKLKNSKVTLSGLSIVFSVSALLFGCDAPQPTAQNPPPKASASTPSVDIIESAKTDASNTAQITQLSDAPKTTETIPAVGESIAASPTPVAKPVAAPALKKPEARPTAEQLAAWKWPEHEPLELLSAKETGRVGLVTCTAQTKDGKFYILGGFQVTMWSVEGKEPEHTFFRADDGKDVFVRAMSISPDGQWLAAGDSEGMLRIWSLVDRKEIVAKQLYTNDIVDLAVSPSGKQIATISFANEVSIWSSDKLESIKKFKMDSNSISRIEFATDEKLLSMGEQAQVWNVADGKLEKTIPGDRYLKTVAWTDDAKSLILGGEKALRRWNPDEAEAVAFIEGNFADNELIAFSPDGTQLVTANGNSVRFWDVASKQCVQLLDAFGTAIVGLNWLPGSNLLVVACETEPVRIWGTAKSGAAVGLQPLHKPVPPPALDSKLPAYPQTVQQTIDFRTFPRIPGSTVSVMMESNVGGEAPVSIDEARLFYRYHFGQRGWLETTDVSDNPMAIEFRKDGFMVSASFYDSGTGKTGFNLDHGTNFDMRWLPKLDFAPTQDGYSSEHNFMYDIKADLLSIETALLRKFQAAGWTPYTKLHSSHNEEADERSLSFVRNSIDLYVTIRKFPAKPDVYAIQHTRFPMSNSLPIPDDSSYVEFDGSVRPHLVATTGKSLAQTHAFYDREMANQGWLPLTIGRTVKEDRIWLPYVQGQKEIVIGLVKLENGRTLVRVGSELERDSYQLAKPKVEDEKKADGPVPGLEAADFPILNGAKETKYDLQGKSIAFRFDATPLADVAERYTKAMAALGWSAEQGGIRADDYTFFNFTNGKKEISFRATLRQGTAEVNIEGDGLLWKKELPTGKRIVSFEYWLRDNKHPAGLELLDRYEAEMKALSTK